ncbi:hypothetical protein L1887_52581 [Cichorium endivia]|nr:hypothetical protein L1887_52581 [Cichorium endivia]
MTSLPGAAFPRGVDLRRARYRRRAPFPAPRVLTRRGRNACCLKATAASATSPILVNESGSDASVGDWRRRRRGDGYRQGRGAPLRGAVRGHPHHCRYLCGVDPALRLIVLNAPAEYLLAGIGDTLAKWYEAVVLAPQPENLPLTVRLGINGALAIPRRAAGAQRRGAVRPAARRTDAGVPGRGGCDYRRRRNGWRPGRALYARGGGACGAQRLNRAAADGKNTCTAPRWPTAFWCKAPCSARTTCWHSWSRRTSVLTCRPRFASWTSISITATSWIGSSPTPCAGWSRFTIYLLR